ncbi:MAG: hypothetical protein GY799_17810 [Desulfobulbaceae bacterium]|nr:hypothetical protein [Desulfobulbaceae bacterium]
MLEGKPEAICVDQDNYISSATHCWAVERQKVKDNGLVATYYYKKDSTQQPPVILFGGSSGGIFYDNYQNYPEDLVDLG